MIDKWALQLFKAPLDRGAAYLKTSGFSADQVSVAGFCCGLAALPALYLHLYWLALIFIIMNRVGDGLDGALARMTEPTDGGAYLDIVLDFIFYAAVVLGFALAAPEENGLAAATLLCSFSGTGGSFLAFAVLAERRGIQNLRYTSKGIYYMGGLAEGAETVAFFLLFCIFPGSFPVLAYCFALVCFITAATRVAGGYLALR
jgi:phosphatidylglycerophosphate synthase